MSRFGDEFAPQSAGAWTKGWYPGCILESFEGGKGTIVRTEDRPSRGGDSRNINLAVAVRNGKEVRNKIVTINYKPEYLTDERIEEVRERVKKAGGKLPQGDPDMGAFLSMRRLRELDILVGAELHLNGDGFDLTPLIGKNADMYVCPDKPNLEGKVYDKISNLDPAGTHVK